TEPQVQQTSDALLRFRGVADQLNNLDLKNLGGFAADFGKDLPTETSNVELLTNKVNTLKTSIADMKDAIKQSAQADYMGGLSSQIGKLQTELDINQKDWDARTAKLMA